MHEAGKCFALRDISNATRGSSFTFSSAIHILILSNTLVTTEGGNLTAVLYNMAGYNSSNFLHQDGFIVMRSTTQPVKTVV